MDSCLGKRNEPLIVRDSGDYFPSHAIKKYALNVLSSPMGCGKTTAICRFISDHHFSKILFITNRVTLAEITSLTFGCTNYLHYASGPIDCNKSIVITINSIRRLINIRDYDLIVLDEFNSTLDMMGSTIVDTEEIVRFFLEKIINIDDAVVKRTVIVSDAILPKDSKDFINKMFLKDNFGSFNINEVSFYPNIKKLPFENVFICDDIDTIFISIIRALVKKKKIVVLTNCTKLCAVFVSLCHINCVELLTKLNIRLKERLNFSYSIFSSETKNKVYETVQNSFVDVKDDLLIFSPIMDSGISIENIDVDEVFGVFCGVTNTVSSMVQMCGRIRKNKTRRVKIGLVTNNNSNVLPSFDEMRTLEKGLCRRNLKFFISNINCDRDMNKNSIRHFITRGDVNNENAVLKIFDTLDSYSDVALDLVKRIYENKRRLQVNFFNELKETFKLNHPDINVERIPGSSYVVCNSLLKVIVNRVKLSDYTLEYSRFANEDNYTSSILSISPCMERLYDTCCFGAKKQFPLHTELFCDKVYQIYLSLPDKLLFDNHSSLFAYIRLLRYINRDDHNVLNEQKIGSISKYTSLYINLFDFFDFDCSMYGIGLLTYESKIDTVRIFARFNELLDILNIEEYFSFYLSKSIDIKKMPSKVKSGGKITGASVSFLTSMVIMLFQQLGYVFEKTTIRPNSNNVNYLLYNPNFDLVPPARPRIYEYSLTQVSLYYTEALIKYGYTKAYNLTKTFQRDFLLEGLYSFSVDDNIQQLTETVDELINETKKEVTSCIWLKETNQSIIREAISKKQKKASVILSLCSVFKTRY